MFVFYYIISFMQIVKSKEDILRYFKIGFDAPKQENIAFRKCSFFVLTQ